MKSICNKKRTYTLAGILVLILSILTLIIIPINNLVNTIIEGNTEIRAMKEDLAQRREEQAFMMAQLDLIEEYARIGSEIKLRDVLFTNYGLWDGESGEKTASGLKVQDCKVNEDGMYTYDGYVVLAVATPDMKNLKKGFITHKMGEVISFELNNKKYQGKVYDKCGGCTTGYTHESLQRVDVMTISNVIGKKQGVVYE